MKEMDETSEAGLSCSGICDIFKKTLSFVNTDDFDKITEQLLENSISWTFFIVLF